MPVVINGTTGISGVNGSAGTPAVQGSDTNTGMFFPAADTIAFAEGGVELARFDSSGNLGLGVTPSAWGEKALQVGPNAAVSSSSSISSFSSNVYWTGSYSGQTYINNGYANAYLNVSGEHRWYNAPSGTAGNAISFTQAMTLDASGNLGIGTSSPAAKLDLGTTVSKDVLLVYGGGSGSQYGLGISAGLLEIYTGATAGISFNQRNGASYTERARIDSSGNLLVGTTSGYDTSLVVIDSTSNTLNRSKLGILGYGSGRGYGIQFRPNIDSGSTPCRFLNAAGTEVGSIATNGTNTSYVTSSDYRLKENVQPMTGALAKVALLKPCTYKWKADGSDGEGFIAHELQAVVPQCVTGEKDAVDAEGNPVYQGIDTSFLVATLTAAIQELKAIVDQQAIEIAAWKGQA